ncbi:MAG TPA: MFS transporter [Anaerolineales bacterium]|nr:MFS transporter [Anaerolineales bacterium]
MNLTRHSIQTTIPAAAFQSSGLVVLFAFVHTVSDAVTNMMSPLLPTLQDRFTLTETTLALLVATLSLSALVTQPIFGALADRIGHRRMAALGVIFNSILFSLVGVVPNISVLFGLILIGGLGSAALHPSIASMARTAGRKKPELAVGLFTAGGTLGIALGPIIIMILLANLGLSFTPWLMVPGIFFGILLLILSPDDDPSTATTSSKILDLRLLTGPVGGLALIGILSNLAFVTFMSATPLWLVHEHNLPSDSALIGWTLCAFSLSAAAGGIAGGIISGWLSPKRLIVGSLLLALLPLYAIFFLMPGSLPYFGAVILAGALVNTGMPMLIVSAQDLAPKSAATASGMLMGFSAGVAGLVYVGIGLLQESIGLAPAMGVSYLALIAAAVLASKIIQTHKTETQPPVDNLTCLCSPCMEQNIAAYPQRQATIVEI